MSRGQEPDSDDSGVRGHRLRWPWWSPYLVVAVATLFLIGLIGDRFHELSRLVWPIFVPLLVSVALAYILDPAVLWWERRGLRRGNAILATLLGVAALLTVGIVFVLPRVAAHLALTSQRLPEVLSGLLAAADPFLQQLRGMNEGLYERVHGRLAEIATNPSGAAAGAIDYLLTGSGSVVALTTTLLDLILIPFFVYYILLDLPRLRSDVELLIPPRYRTNVHEVFDRVAAVGSNFIRGQIVVSAWMSALYAAAYLLLGVPLAVVLGIFSGFANLIPYLGPVMAFVGVAVLTAVESPEWWRVAGILGATVLIQIVEQIVLTPRILGERLSLHPFLVLAGITIGGYLFGVLGMVLATPTIAVIRVLMTYAHHSYLHSRFYQGSVPVFTAVASASPTGNASFRDASAETAELTGKTVSPVTGKPAA